MIHFKNILKILHKLYNITMMTLLLLLVVICSPLLWFIAAAVGAYQKHELERRARNGYIKTRTGFKPIYECKPERLSHHYNSNTNSGAVLGGIEDN